MARTQHLEGAARPSRPERWQAALALAGVLTGVLAAAAHAGLAPDVEAQLRASTYVYIASQRRDGTFGEPAEIWFMYRDGAVWIATPATAWRAKRLRAGRPAATIAVGTRTGPTFDATGRLVTDPTAYAALFARFAEKYPSGWSTYEARFRSGLADGSRVLIRYDPR